MSELNTSNGDRDNGSPAAVAPMVNNGGYPTMGFLTAEIAGNGLPPALSSPPDATGLLRALGRRWVAAIVFGVIVGSGAAALTWFVFPTYYTTSALLQIAANEPRLVFQTADPVREFGIYKKTQRELVKSRDVLEAALRPAKISALLPEEASEDPVRWLANQINVGFPGDAELMRISMSGKDRTILAPLVNAVKEAYTQRVEDSERGQRQDRLKQLEEIARADEKFLRERREQLRRLSDQLGTGEPQTLAAMQRFAIQRQTQLWQASVQKDIELTEAQVELGLGEQLLDSPEKIPIADWQIDTQLNSDPRYQAQVQRVRLLQEDVQRLERSAHNANEPRLVRLRQTLSTAEETLEKTREERKQYWMGRLQTFASVEQQTLVDRLRSKVNMLQQHRDRLRNEADQVKLEAEKAGKDTVGLELLRAEIAQKESTAQSVQKELDALRIELQAPSRVVVIDDATAPRTRDTEKRLPVTVLAGAMALCCVTALVTWLEYRSRRIGTSAELTSGLQMKVLGALPNLRERSSRRLGVPSRARDAYWQWRFTESVHTIRTVLLHAARRDSTRVVLVTSAVGGEGKTTLTSHLGISLAAAGKRVLIVDGDTRSPMLHSLFDVPMDPGLSEALAGETQFGDLVHPTPATNLWLLTAGRNDAHVAQSLSQEVLNDLVARLRENYDFVLIDSPPVLSVSDALVLGQRSDAAILATMQDVSRLPLIYEAYQRLTRLGVNVLGAVINGSTDQYSGSYQHRDRQIAMSEA